LAWLLDPDRQDPYDTCGPPKVNRRSVLPTELGVLRFLHLAGFCGAPDLCDEGVGAGLREARCGEDPGLETADRVNRGEQIPANLPIVNLNAIGSR